jgi:hypothetical protein
MGKANNDSVNHGDAACGTEAHRIRMSFGIDMWQTGIDVGQHMKERLLHSAIIPISS